MRIAIIDCGTNTFNLLVGSVKPEGIVLDFKTKIPVKLGSGGFKDKVIEEKAFKRGFEALNTYKGVLEKMNLKEVYCFGTSALRSAENADFFKQSVYVATNIFINIISGDSEAELIYSGVREALTIHEPSLIMDIGGGSTEFIICNSDGLIWKHSYDIGAARLLEWINPSDPIRPSEIQKTQEILRESLEEVFSMSRNLEVKTLIGSSGSFDTLASMVHHRFNKPLDFASKTFDFPVKETQILLDEIIESTYSERLKMPGMIEMRADMMVMSAQLMKFILEKGHMNCMKLSTHALKEGAFYEISKNPEKWRKSSL